MTGIMVCIKKFVLLDEEMNGFTPWYEGLWPLKFWG